MSAPGSGALIWAVPDAPIDLRNVPEQTDADQISIAWTDAANYGSTPIIDFTLWFALEGTNFEVMEAGILAREYTTAVTLNAGQNYKFKVQARNAVGYSADSAEVTIRAARIPDAPTGVLTSFGTTAVQISWTKPYNGGSLITAYTVEIRHSDGISFSEDDTYCDGTVSTLVSTRTCSIPIDKIRAAPYLHDWGAHIWARVKAVNIVGSSEFSAEGNGAQIITNPDPPTLLADVPEITSKT